MIYIMTCYGDKLFDKLIKKIMGTPYTHTAIQISNTLCIETGVFGVKISSIEKKKGRFIRHKFKDITLEQESKLKEALLDSLHIKYDYSLMFALGINKVFKLNLNWDTKNEYICTEVIVEVVRDVLGIDLIDFKEDKHIGPWDIPNSRHLELVE